MFVFNNHIVDHTGRNSSYWQNSILCFFGIVLFVNLQLMVDTQTYTIFTFVSYLGFSLILFAIFVFVWDLITVSTLQHSLIDILGTP